jgi:hypothetical protein
MIIGDMRDFGCPLLLNIKPRTFRKRAKEKFGI